MAMQKECKKFVKRKTEEEKKHEPRKCKDTWEQKCGSVK